MGRFKRFTASYPLEGYRTAMPNDVQTIRRNASLIDAEVYRCETILKELDALRETNRSMCSHSDGYEVAVYGPEIRDTDFKCPSCGKPFPQTIYR